MVVWLYVYVYIADAASSDPFSCLETEDPSKLLCFRQHVLLKQELQTDTMHDFHQLVAMVVSFSTFLLCVTILLNINPRNSVINIIYLYYYC